MRVTKKDFDAAREKVSFLFVTNKSTLAQQIALQVLYSKNEGGGLILLGLIARNLIPLRSARPALSVDSYRHEVAAALRREIECATNGLDRSLVERLIYVPQLAEHNHKR